jgi:predicted permease
VAAELAITFVMLLGTGLLANSFVRLTAVDVGFETNNLALVTVRLQKDRYPTVALENQFYKEALRRARLMPGITEVSAGGAVPPRAGIRFNISEQSDAQGSPISAVTTSVEPNYFQTLRIPMLSGRPFNDRDTPHGDRVAIVNEEIARELWPDRDPIGQRLRVGSHLALVVGVVSDVKGYQFRSGSDRFKAYLPLTQEPPRGSWVLVARTSSDPNGVVRQLRQLVNDIDPNAMIREATTAEASYDTMLTVPRLIFQFMAVFSGGALLLALIGIYGLVASDVAQRRQEIGIRMALGADSAQIGRLAVRDAIRPAAIGLSLGAAGGLAGSMLLRGFLYELSPHDPVTLFCVGAVQLATVAIVAWLPARRASRLDPIATLRTD